MRGLFLLALIIGSTIGAFGQAKSHDSILSVNFGPSFMSASTIVISYEGNSNYVNLGVYKNYKKKKFAFQEKKIVNSNNLNSLLEFLKSYQFQIKNNVDTIGSRKEFKNGDSVVVYRIDVGLDGIYVTGSLNQFNKIRKFAFWSPEKGTDNLRLIQILFELMNQSFTNWKSINYVELLEQYFPHQLGVKKLSDRPLAYKLYGSITSTETDQLSAFLKNLPLGQEITIDMSNYSGMGTMFYPEFRQYCANNKNIYWLNPTFRGLIDLYKIGIPNSNVISKRKITEIKENNGDEVVSSEEE